MQTYVNNRYCKIIYRTSMRWRATGATAYEGSLTSIGYYLLRSFVPVSDHRLSGRFRNSIRSNSIINLRLANRSAVSSTGVHRRRVIY